MQKSADAFRTISEVAEHLSMPQHVLRFWETRFPQIRPLKRAGGRRYYRPADVVLLRTIRQLLYDDGYTIKGVQRLLKEQGAKGLVAGPRPSEPDADVDSDEAGPDAMDRAGVELAEADQAPRTPAGTQPAAAAGIDRAALLDALAAIDECRRILDALRHDK